MSLPPETGFDPNSNNAVLARLLEQVEGLRDDFKAYRIETEKRLRDLEIENATGRGKTVVVSALCAMGLSFVAQWLLKKG